LGIAIPNTQAYAFNSAPSGTSLNPITSFDQAQQKFEPIGASKVGCKSRTI